ncbi:AMP-binding protein [Vulcanisaeta souniana]|uniref:AMP-dependent synthetase n=1 Tax=Vulcanisaeta souniana JCM 11219 TaxID=1293586 RepID=A0A830ED51_9CREN|nr:AMP-binding protein [Vulcanisaeta souniana]BDR91705.1 AMP-dependent synthetase [Vulcanisaeta souniana JCM 11219]GGI71071.1 AMP-dependent synthetase [Vulcanisaeta souniana JCM 11219]
MSDPGIGFTVHNVIRRAATLCPETEIVWENRRISYGEAYNRVVSLADSLLSLGIRKGTVIGVADWNTLPMFELHYAAAMIGAIIYPVNIRLPLDQMAHTMKVAEVEWLFYSNDFKALSTLISKDRTVGLSPECNAKYCYNDLLSNKTIEEPEVEVTGRDYFSILFTSGTTGLPKAVRYTHEKFVHGALAIAYQLGMYNTPASLHQGDVIMPLIPFYHIHSWGSLIHAPYLCNKYVLIGRFMPDRALTLIETEKVTWISAVPTMMYMLIDAAEKMNKLYVLRGLKALVGGMPIASGLAKRMQELSIGFSTIYGGTDMLVTSISIAPRKYNSIDEFLDYMRLTTHPVPFVEIRIIDPATGKDVSPGQIGEVWLRAPWLPYEYYKDAEKTRESYVGSWFRTGDVGVLLSDGGLRVLDRIKDVIKSGGEWIPTSILEAIISNIPGIDMVAVIGKPSERWGERPIAVIKLREGYVLTKEQIYEVLNREVDSGRIPKWWMPDDIIFVNEIPLTSTGKIDKKELKKNVLGHGY